MENDEVSQDIDYIEILNTIISGKKKIFISLLIFTILGLFIAAFTPNEYRASTIFISQGSGKANGKLGGLAAIAGINVGAGTQESGIPLSLYSEIINSVPYKRELIKTQLTIKGRKEKVSYKEYYLNYFSPGLLAGIKKYTIGLPSVILGGGKKSNEKNKVNHKTDHELITITKEEKKLFNQLMNQIFLEINEENNSVTISGVMQEAIHAAELINEAQKLLEKYIIDFKIKKSVTKLSFIQKRYEEKEKVYKEKQQQLANYLDRNRFLSSERSQSRLITLQSEYDLASSIYNQLATQIEMQQLQVKEDTPIFTIVNPVTVPLHKSAPKRVNILLTWMFGGILISVFFILGKKYYIEFRDKINKKV